VEGLRAIERIPEGAIGGDLAFFVQFQNRQNLAKSVRIKDLGLLSLDAD